MLALLHTLSLHVPVMVDVIAVSVNVKATRYI
jgi:hypothetical protein